MHCLASNIAYNTPLLSQDQLIGIPFVQKAMSRNHFNKLSKQIHLNNNANQVPHEHPAYDKLFTVRPVHDRIVQCCKREMRPQRHLSVDEAMIQFQGRLAMKQYTCMLMKPVKHVIKVWVFAKALNGFLCDFQVYMESDKMA